MLAAHGLHALHPKGIPNICNKVQKQKRYPFQKINLYPERAAWLKATRMDTF